MQRLSVCAVRDCGRFTIKLHEKLKRATNLRIPLKPLLAIPRVSHRFYFFNSFSINLIVNSNPFEF